MAAHVDPVMVIVSPSKARPKPYVELSSTAAPDVSISQEHAVRERLRHLVAALPHKIWLTVELVPRTHPDGDERP